MSQVEVQPLIAVRDVRASAHWYTKLLGASSLPEHDHRNPYDRISCGGRLINADASPHGHGVVLWFEVDDFDAAVQRARQLRVEIIVEPHVNAAPGHREMWLRDADGYTVVIASPDGEATAT